MDFCNNPHINLEYKSFIMVLFGGGGDLARKKLLPSIYNLYKYGYLKEDFRIISFGHPNIKKDEYLNIVKEVIGVEDKNFFEKIEFLYGDFDNKNDYIKLGKLIEKNKKLSNNLIFNLAIPPIFFEEAVVNIEEILIKNNKNIKKKILIEKPFGVDYISAKKLNDFLQLVFREEEIYRIDHYLGKETVQNILFFRFGNTIFEPIWNRNYIDHIQIIVAEEIGIENRGKFYEEAGIIRDIIQNHMLQLIALITMQAPTDFSPESIREERVKVFKSLRKMSDDYIRENIILGQYGGGRGRSYLEEDNVAKDSKVATYFAGKLYVDNWAFEGVPIYVLSGKKLKKKITKVYIEFKKPPLILFGDLCNNFKSNSLTLTIEPREKMTLNLNLKFPGNSNYSHNISFDFDYNMYGTKELSAYERLLLDCIRGDLTLFARQDGVEYMWKGVEKIINLFENGQNEYIIKYDNYTWGPKEAMDFLKKDKKSWRFEDE